MPVCHTRSGYARVVEWGLTELPVEKQKFRRVHGGKETVRAVMREMVPRLLRKYKNPPDLQETATELILVQAETLAEAQA